MPTLKNPAYERFAQLLSEGKTGVDAYLDAGHEVSRKVAGVNASRLLKNPDVKARIEELLERRASIEIKATEKAVEALAITKEQILEELRQIGFAKPLDFEHWGGASARHLQAKIAALEKLGKILGHFKDVVELTGKDGGPIETQDSPRPTGQDHLAGLTKRYASGLRVIEGGAKEKAG